MIVQLAVLLVLCGGLAFLLSWTKHEQYYELNLLCWVLSILVLIGGVIASGLGGVE